MVEVRRLITPEILVEIEAETIVGGEVTDKRMGQGPSKVACPALLEPGP
jgi:hypothetical protein